VAIAPSRFMAQAVAPYLMCPVYHIPNFAPDENPSGAIADPEEYFLFIGVLEAHKGVRQLIQAIPRLKSTRLKIVGMGSQFRHLKMLEGTGRVDVEGWVPRQRLRALYRGAKALLVPSIWLENAPLAAIEALSHGTPLLASHRGGLGEMLHNGTAGRSFEPNADAILAAVDRFEREGLDRSLRRSSRLAYETFHRPGIYLDRYLEIVRAGRPARRQRSIPGTNATFDGAPQTALPKAAVQVDPSVAISAEWNSVRR
jgi:glycosyltransferase involved in cell wall biosynthesis